MSHDLHLCRGERRKQKLGFRVGSRYSRSVRPDGALARVHLFYAAHLRKKHEYEEAEEHLKQATSFVRDVRQGTCTANPDDIVKEYIALYEVWDRPHEKESFVSNIG